MRVHKLHLPSEATAFWLADIVSTLPFARIVLGWGQVEGPTKKYVVGELSTRLSLLRATLAWDGEPMPGAEKQKQPKKSRVLEDLLGQSFTRAGWQRPRMSPDQWQMLVAMRSRRDARQEFILDTNALISGSIQWLAELFSNSSDLRLTPVSSEEIQDFHSRCQWGQPPNFDLIRTRHSYLAAQRFREFSGLSRVLWLPIDLLSDETLQLARGSHEGKKSSGNDSAVLRATHRLIQDRVNGLERFFVCGDGSLARRAAVELPPQSVILARTLDAESGRYYSPCRWWPGPDEGRALLFATPVRLVWELLALSDWVELQPMEGHSGPTYRFQAFQKEMWIADHATPWIRVSVSTPHKDIEPDRSLPEKAPEVPNEHDGPGLAKDGSNIQSAVTVQPFALELAPALSPSVVVESVPTKAISLSDLLFEQKLNFEIPRHLQLDANLRFDAEYVLDMLALVSRMDPDSSTRSPEWLKQMNDQQQGDLRRLFHSLRLADISKDAKQISLLDEAMTLREIWKENDIETLALFLRRYVPFAEILDYQPDKLPVRPTRTTESARVLAARLGHIVRIEKTLFRGSENPQMGSIRSVMLQYFKQQPTLDNAYSIYEFFVNVLLKKLQVSPVRAMRAWSRMEQSGVFADIELRTGGTADNRKFQEAIDLIPNGWQTHRFLLEVFQGKRDLVDRRKGHG